MSSTETKVFTISQAKINRVKRRLKHVKTDNKRRPDSTGRDAGSKKPRKAVDPFPGKAPIKEELLQKHSRGDGVRRAKIKTKFAKKMATRREQKIKSIEETAARTELLLQEQSGYLETEKDDPEEFTARISQVMLKKVVEPEAAVKGFDLNLKEFGPYVLDYTRNGRFLLLGGRKGHVACLDWNDKKLKCEINVMESVHDVQWLHNENMFAVAQKKWTYIYDNQGIELHCIKALDNVLKLEFLPYHFLLASVSESGFLSWLDVSLGKMVAQFNSRMGRTSLMCQNPWNAVMCLGHSKGVVTMWTPNSKEAVASILVHKQPVTGLCVDRSGQYMATAGMDRSLKVWDIRNTYRYLKSFRLPGQTGAANLHFSDRRLLGLSLDRQVQIFKDCCTEDISYPYMTHQVHGHVQNLQFVPFEDVMGIGHAAGFTSILVPGSGEPNFDALEANPYQTKRQRREAEVKALLDKIQPELISLNPNDMAEIDVLTLQEKVLEKNAKVFVKPEKIDFEPRKKSKGKSGTAKNFYIKRTVQEEAKMREIKSQLESLDEQRQGKTKQAKQPKKLLERL